MDRIIISPSKYVQGNGALANIGNYVKALGAKPLILADRPPAGALQADPV